MCNNLKVKYKQRSSVCVGASNALPSPLHALRASRAFTLVELLVVIVVIAILMGISLPVGKYAIRRANEAKQEVMLAKIRSALDDYRAAYGEYPITPMTNQPAGTKPDNYNDAIRHYPDNYPTYCYFTSNSPYTNVYLVSSGTVERIGSGVDYWVDYCLTYPLMLKQTDKGSAPYYLFPDVTVMSLVYKRFSDDEWEQTQYRKGGLKKTLKGLYGAQVNRPKATDPVSQKQWKYECYDGIAYKITTNSSF